MMVAPDRAPWQNPRILTTLLFVFVAGAATGALFMQLGLHGWIHRAVAPSPQARNLHAADHDAILNRFKSELDLSSDQTSKLSLVLDDYSQYYESLQEQLNDLRATGKSRIMNILDPDQRAKFEKVMNDLAPQLSGSDAAPAR